MTLFSELSQSTLWSLIGIGMVLIAGLLFIIFRQMRELRVPVQEAEAMPADKHLLGLEDSLTVIAQLLLDDQVEVSEACMRIKVLLDHYDSTMHEDPVFSVFVKVYDALSHMPTHQARKQTDKKFIQKLDQQRFQIEEQYRSAAKDAADALLKRFGGPQTEASPFVLHKH